MAGPLLLHVFPSFVPGGAQLRFAAIANHFGAAYRHAIVAMDGRDECRSRLRADLDVWFPDVTVRKGDTFGNLRRFRRLLRDLRPATLITSNWGSIEWAMANVPPLVRHVHMEDGFGPEERDAQLRRRVWMRRLLLRRSTVMLPSRRLLRIATEVWRLDPRRLQYVPNGIDAAAFAPASDVAEGWPAEGPVIGTVAALRAEKNLARLLHAFQMLRAQRPARLVIVGDGPERAGLEALAATLGIAEAVEFTGHVAAPQSLYRGFDLFALTSDTEQMPLSVLEAMAAGLPVVATDVGDIRAMLAAENVAGVVPRDASAVAAALAALLDDAAHARAIGRANRCKLERDYDQQQMFRRYAALFDGARRA
jgi:glycosyltransferase involved in cell wall biosynthesis